MTHQVRDGSRLITFDGTLLGFVTSERPEVARWTEMSVYLTEGGSYVLEKVGRSLICHMPGCNELGSRSLPRFQEQHPGDDPDNGYVFHEECVPEEYDFTRLLIEENRYWATVTQDPHEIVAALEKRKDGGIKVLPRIGMELLEKVSENHPDFGEFWRQGHIA